MTLPSFPERCLACGAPVDFELSRRSFDFRCPACGRVNNASPTQWTLLQPFDGDPRIKAELVDRLRDEGAFTGNRYFKWLHECDVQLEDKVHDGAVHFQIRFGIPALIANLFHGIYSGLPPEESGRFAESFFASIAPGAALGDVWPAFALWLLSDGEYGVLRHERRVEFREIIEGVIKLYEQRCLDWHGWDQLIDVADEMTFGREEQKSFPLEAAVEAAVVAGRDEDGFNRYRASSVCRAAAWSGNSTNASDAAGLTGGKDKFTDRVHSAVIKHYHAQATKLLELLAAARPGGV